MDDHGFREYVLARLAWLSRVAYLLTGDHHAAEDLLQSALVKVGTRWRRVEAADEPDAYVRKILYHEQVSVWRRRVRVAEDPVAEPPEMAAVGDLADDTVRHVMLRNALAKLTPRQRAVIVLRYFEDLSEVDAADVLGCSVGTVKSQTNHALGRLRILAPELADLIQESKEVLPWKA
jgi:RNA polymerase sigma-70 factor (sigma-E family)